MALSLATQPGYASHPPQLPAPPALGQKFRRGDQYLGQTLRNALYPEARRAYPLGNWPGVTIRIPYVLAEYDSPIPGMVHHVVPQFCAEKFAPARGYRGKNGQISLRDNDKLASSGRINLAVKANSSS
jgi:hypothetical protein